MSQRIDSNIPLLEYKEAKSKLSEYLNQIENSLKDCEKKHGEISEVEATMQRFQNSIGDEMSLNNNYESLREEISKREIAAVSAGLINTNDVEKFMSTTHERWRQLLVEIGSVQTMLQEIIKNWKRYNALRDLFTVWLKEAEDMLHRSNLEDEKTTVCIK